MNMSRLRVLTIIALTLVGVGAVDDVSIAAGRGAWEVAGQLALVVVVCVCLAFGRRGVFVAAGVTVLSSILSFVTLDGMSTWLSWVIFAMAIGVLGVGWLSVGAVLAFALWVLGMAITGVPFISQGYWLSVVPVLFSFGLGVVIGHLVRGLDASRAAVVRAQEEAAETRESERLLLARELHHGVARNLTLAGVHAALLARDHPETAPSATAIEGVCREATADLGRLIGILTADVPEQGSVPDRTDPDVGRKDLGDVVDAQVRHLRASGHDVEVTCTARDVPLAIVDTAGRILEEAVANVIRHAGGGSRCEVAVTTSSQHLDVRVVNTVTDTARRGTSSTRLGLVALGERVRLLKGTFSAGLEPDGRWVLSAHVPMRSPLDAGLPESPFLTPEEEADAEADERRLAAEAEEKALRGSS